MRGNLTVSKIVLNFERHPLFIEVGILKKKKKKKTYGGKS